MDMDIDLCNYLLDHDPVVSSALMTNNRYSSSQMFQQWEDLDTPTIDVDTDIDRMLETIRRQDAADAATDEHSYAVASLEPYDEEIIILEDNVQNSNSPSPSSSSYTNSTHSPTSQRFYSERRTSESSSGYDSSEILEMATRAAGVFQAERITPARRMSRPTALPVATERYAQRNAQRQRGITQADAKDPLRQTKNTSKYPALMLSEEERRYMIKENIKLPTHYPLKKSEESLLKRIRRKIRNKKSAQTSRKKQKEYIDALEYRTDILESEKVELREQVDELSKQNSTLLEQIRKLQEAVSNGTRRSAQASTCLAVLLLSFMLVLSPSWHPLMNQNDTNDSTTPSMQLHERSIADNKNIAINTQPAIVPGRSRTLLSTSADNSPVDGRSRWDDDLPWAFTQTTNAHVHQYHHIDAKYDNDEETLLSTAMWKRTRMIEPKIEPMVDEAEEYSAAAVRVNHTYKNGKSVTIGNPNIYDL